MIGTVSRTVLIQEVQKNQAEGRVLSSGPRLETRDSRPETRDQVGCLYSRLLNDNHILGGIIMDDKKKIFVYGAGISGQGVSEVLARKGSAVILYNDDKRNWIRPG